MEQAAKALFSRLSGTFSNRVYPHQKPPTKKTYPLCVYKLVETEPADTHTDATKLVEQQFDLAIIANTYAELLTLKTTVNGLLHKQRYTSGGIEIEGSFLDSDSMDISALSDTKSELWVYEVSGSLWVKL